MESSPGESIQFSIQQQGIMDRIAMGPVGVFIVQDDETLAVTTHVEWMKAKGLENLLIPTAKDRYATMEGLKKLEKTELNWIVPPPIISFLKGHLEIKIRCGLLIWMNNFRNKRIDSAL